MIFHIFMKKWSKIQNCEWKPPHCCKSMSLPDFWLHKTLLTWSLHVNFWHIWPPEWLLWLFYCLMSDTCDSGPQSICFTKSMTLTSHCARWFIWTLMCCWFSWLSLICVCVCVCGRGMSRWWKQLACVNCGTLDYCLSTVRTCWLG